MKVVVGLGNPGPRYAATRHNLGYRVVDRLAGALGARRVDWDGPGDLARSAEGGDGEVWFLKPTTFMNASGAAVAALGREGPAAGFLPGDLLVVLDDVYLEFGRLRLRLSGSEGGHNGLASVLEALGTTAVPRLRCGVGPLPPEEDLIGFVLEDFPGPEAGDLPEFIDRAAQAARKYLEEGPIAAMNHFNR